MPVLPLSKNIGPGNVPDPQSSNWVDAEAYHHDRAYGSASSQSDIRQADKDFLLHLTKYPDTNPVNFAHQLVGGLGIGAKYLAESVAGVQYPNLPGMNAETMDIPYTPSHSKAGEPMDVSSSVVSPVKTQAAGAKTDSTGESPSKKRKGAEIGEALVVADKKGGKKATGGSVSAMGDGGSSNEVELLSGPCPTISHLNSFKTCKTFDLELVTFNPNFLVKNGTNPIGTWIAPLYSFAVEQLGWYLNQGELNWLNSINGATQTIKHCGGSITIGTINSPFVTQTAASNQTSANSHVNLSLYHGHGLEKEFLLYNGLGTIDYATATGDYPLTAWTSGLYDPETLTKYDFNVSPLVLPATHVMRKYNQLVGFPAHCTAVAVTEVNGNTLLPPVYKDKMTKLVETTGGGVLNQWSYKPNCKFAIQNTPSVQWNGQIQLGTNAQPINAVDDASVLASSNQKMAVETKNQIIMNHKKVIMMNNTINIGHGGHMKPAAHTIPREYIGFLPPTTVNGTSVQPIKIHIQVKTEIEIGMEMNHNYSVNACNTLNAALYAWPTATLGECERMNDQENIGTTDVWAGIQGLKQYYGP